MMRYAIYKIILFKPIPHKLYNVNGKFYKKLNIEITKKKKKNCNLSTQCMRGQQPFFVGLY